MQFEILTAILLGKKHRTPKTLNTDDNLISIYLIPFSVGFVMDGKRGQKCHYFKINLCFTLWLFHLEADSAVSESGFCFMTIYCVENIQETAM